MTDSTRMSVALCTFNGGRFVRQQIESILGQTPRPAQLVVSDDGSTDDTLAIVREVTDTPLADGVDVVVLTGSRPLGVTKNFERAVSATDGDLIALSDQDDIWHPGRLERIRARFIAEPDLLLLHTDADLVDGDGAPLGRTLFESLEITPEEFGAELSGRAFDAFIRRNLATGATVVFRRELLPVTIPFPERWVHDEWLAIVAAATGGADVLRESTIDYRQHDTNQIGVAAPSLASKVKRVLEPRSDRNAVLAERFTILAQRLEELGDRVPAEITAAAREKARFEAERAALPANRFRRAAGVRKLAASGRYERFASRGRADIIRDLLQPA
jgi:hypothetical protein